MIKFKNRNLTKLRIVFFPIISAIGIISWFLNENSFFTFLIIFLIGHFFSILGTIGSHRWLCHNMFVPNKLGKYLMMTGMLFESIGKPSQIVITHRLHHKYADTDKDPHSPKHKTFLDLLLGNYQPIISLPPIRDFLRNKEIQWFDKHYWILWILFNLCLLIINWEIAIIFTPIIFTKTWIMTTILNYYGHGGKKLKIKNLNFLGTFLTAGEGLHKNHHQHPNKWKYDSNNEYTDICAILIKYILIKK